MKTRTRGVALVIVLSFLVLISALIVAFFSSVSTEYNASKSYADGVTTRQLADSAVNIVMGQVQEAASQTNTAWASQPGMIRTFGDNGQPSDKVSAFYKLYSSDRMSLTGNEVTQTQFEPGEDIPKEWYKKPALAVDLNAPVKFNNPDAAASEKIIYRYPIMDPGYSTTMVTSKGGNVANMVEGFDIEADKTDSRGLPMEESLARMPVRWMYVLKDGTVTAPDKESGNNGVEWSEATTKDKLPTKANPIVGRIAFWADDETSKVNINTAGGYSTKETYGYTINNFAGSYWDTPRTNTTFDRGEFDSATGIPLPGKAGLALCQPVNGEFQRYPGHPSTTSLGVIFKEFLTSEQLYRLTPRIFGGEDRSSMGGTNRIIVSATGYAELTPGKPIPRKDDRLYASVDELLFAESKKDNTDPLNPTTNFVDSDNERYTNDDVIKATKVVTPDLLEKTRFFLTANSRSPELNLFGHPKVTIWPIYGSALTGKAQREADSLKYRNAADRLIAFCSTIGKDALQTDSSGKPSDRLFIFQRNDAYSATTDYEKIPRNKELYSYLKKQTSLGIPGFGPVSFSDKYLEQRSQILTEIFDYIRTVNLRDTSTNPVLVTMADRQTQKYAKKGVVVPLRIQDNDGSTYRGVGRMPTVAEAALVIYHAGYLADDINTPGLEKIFTPQLTAVENDVLGNPRMVPFPKVVVTDPATGKKTTKEYRVRGIRARAFLVLRYFNPMQGYAPMEDLRRSTNVNSANYYEASSAIKVEVSGMTNGGGFSLSQDQVTYYPLFAKDSDSYNLVLGPGSVWHGRNFGGNEGFTHAFYGTHDPLASDSGGGWLTQEIGLKRGYPFQSSVQGVDLELPVPDDGPNGAQLIALDSWSNEVPGVSLRGGKLNISLTYQGAVRGEAPTSTKRQSTKGATVTLEFPDAVIPMPTDAVWVQQADGSNNGQGTVTTGPGPNMKITSPGAAMPSSPLPIPGGTMTWPLSDARVNRSLGPKGSNGGSYAYACNQQNFTYGTAAGNVTVPLNIVPRSLATRIAWACQDASDQRNWDTPAANADGRWKMYCQPGDTVRSVVYNGDLRVAALGDSTGFAAHPDYADRRIRQAQSLRAGAGVTYYAGCFCEPWVQRDDAGATMPNPKTYGRLTTNYGNLAEQKKYSASVLSYHSSWSSFAARYPDSAGPDLPASRDLRAPGNNGVKNFKGERGDFDTGLGTYPDGGYAGKADEGNLFYRYWDSFNSKWVYQYPYYTWNYEEGSDTFFTPNRQIPSAVAFGSLPAGNTPETGRWRTLCFSPNPAAKSKHDGNAREPKDHLLLDLFTMPVVEPYAISEPFSTAGKVNLNYEIVPFGHIHRSTAMRAALQGVRIPALPLESGVGPKATPEIAVYKTSYRNVVYRIPLDREATIESMNKRFGKYTASNPELGFFKSATQICEQFLYPNAPKVAVDENDAAIQNWWDAYRLTGDNLREKPYADLYPRVTTKSNTYTVHMYVQTLRKRQFSGSGKEASHYARWEEDKDQVMSEYRGSAIIERYLNPQDRRFDVTNPITKDLGDELNTETDSLESAYNFRVLNVKRFLP